MDLQKKTKARIRHATAESAQGDEDEPGICFLPLARIYRDKLLDAQWCFADWTGPSGRDNQPLRVDEVSLPSPHAGLEIARTSCMHGQQCK